MYTAIAPQIRKDYLTDLYSKAELARKYQCTRETISRILKHGDQPYVYVRTSHPENCLIQPYKDYIYNWLKNANAEATAVWARITKMGARISQSTVTKAVAKIKHELDLDAIRYETTPGRQAQADWGAFPGYTANIDGKERPLYAFFLILGYSRTRFVEFTTQMTTEVLITCIEDALYYYAAHCPNGGCPEEILFDNMPQVVSRVLQTPWKIDKKPELLPEFTAFSDWIGFDIRLCRVRRPQEKGKVERFVQYFKNNFIQALEKKNGHDLKELNRLAKEWCDQVNSKKHFTTNEIPFERLKEEPLKPMPEYRYYENKTIHVNKDGSVAFHGGVYHVDKRFAGCAGTAVDCCPVIFANIDGEFVILGKRDLPVRVRKRYYVSGQILFIQYVIQSSVLQ